MQRFFIFKGTSKRSKNKHKKPYNALLSIVIAILQCMRMRIIIPLLLLASCSTNKSGPDVLMIDSSNYAVAFDAAVEAAGQEGMKAVLLDRRGGIISTDSVIAGSLVEPWKPRAATARQGLENTLTLQRRAARFEFTPVKQSLTQIEKLGSLRGPDYLSPSGEDLTSYTGPMELRVWVYVDRQYTQGIRRDTWSLQSESRTTVLAAQEPWEQVPGTFWMSVNRDVAKEQLILASVEALLSIN